MKAEAPCGSICFITTEFHGLFKNGGIGTSNTGLALALADAGFEVTVAFANSDETGPRVKGGNFDELKAQYAQRGIALDYVPPHAPRAFNDPRSASLSIYGWLAARAFDVVLFNDNGGQGFYALQAGQAGLWPDAPQMFVVAHGPFDWVLDLNAMEYWNREPVMVGFMERRCAALADRLISPSRYLVGWMQARGWALPERTQVIQNLVGAPVRPAYAAGHVAGRPVSEIVFFGRQEIRKGLLLFCDAIDGLAAHTDLSGLTITFLGKFSKLGSLHSGIFLAERARAWPVTLRIASDFDQQEALEYLARPGVLAVIPSLAENSPCVVAECLQLGLPFLATDSGGTAELVAPEDRAACLFAPTHATLTARLAEMLPAMPPPARLAVDQAATRAAWVALLAGAVAGRREAAVAAGEAAPHRISVVLAHTLAWPADAVLASLLPQSALCGEILLAWDGLATLPDAPAPAGTRLRVIDVGECDLGTARHMAAERAREAAILFVDPRGVTLLPGCIAALVAAADRLGADIVTGLPDQAPAPLLPVGACVELGVLENCFGQGVLLVAAAAYRRAPAFAAGEDAQHLDWLFLAGAVLQGARLEVVPAACYARAVAAFPADPGQAVLRYRQVVAAYEGAPIGAVGRLLEGLMKFSAGAAEALPLSLPQVSGAAMDIARRLVTIDANGPEATRAFVNYCCERRLNALALDFAMLNGGLHLGEATLGAARVTGADAMAAIRRRPLDTLHRLDLSREVQPRLRAVAPLRTAQLTRQPHSVVSHELGLDAVVMKAAGVCPPGTARVQASVARVAGGDAAQVALAVCDPLARMMLTDTLQTQDGRAHWSGWVDLPREQESVDVELGLAAPLPELFDLYLLARRREPSFGRAFRLCWSKVAADLQVTGASSPSRIARDSLLAAVPVETWRAGELLTEASFVGFPIFVPGERTLMHPIPGMMTLVRLAGALPAGAVGLKARVCLEDERAHPIDYALWALPADAGISGQADLPPGDWHTVFDPLASHFLELALPAPAPQKLDIYLATRASHSRDTHFCHAYWHDLWIVEPANPARIVETA